jgi:protein-tyrosine phosphatase
MSQSLVDIHCHLLPGIDDGAKDWGESLAMARMAVADGIATIIATPHQLGNFRQNAGDDIRHRVRELQQRLDAEQISLQVLAGADVRIEPDMIAGIVRGDVLTLADRRKHVLLELPHELYLPLHPVLHELTQRNITGILSHPERNLGILRQPDVLAPLVDAGCLLQVTAGSLCGAIGRECQEFSEWLLSEGMVHFLATDAHGPRSRRPLLRRAFKRACELTDEQTARDLCSVNPGRVARGQSVPGGRRERPRRRRKWFLSKSA